MALLADAIDNDRRAVELHGGLHWSVLRLLPSDAEWTMDRRFVQAFADWLEQGTRRREADTHPILDMDIKKEVARFVSGPHRWKISRDAVGVLHLYYTVK